mgnify:CR=1 FL=1
MIEGLVGFVVGVLLGAGATWVLKPTMKKKVEGLSDGS